MEEKNKKADYSINNLTFVVLVMLTLGEFVMAVISTTNIVAVMLGLGLFKAWMIVANYMHIGKLFSSDEEAHE